jgi:hypothetical protein
MNNKNGEIMTSVDDILKKYSKQLELQTRRLNSNESTIEYNSKDYIQFKKDMMPELSRYEKWARSVNLRIKINPKDRIRIAKDLEVAHIELEPEEVVGLTIITSIGFFFLSLIICVGIWAFDPLFPSLDVFPSLFFFLLFVISIFLGYYFYSMPSRLATKWRLKASSQMVPAILYTVIYMKHTSNLERAINFVAQHIEAPLSLDFKKVLWEVQNGRYPTLKEALDNYLDFWKDTNVEFVESFHLIESSLYEPSDARRLMILERALKVILDGVYENMLKYTRSTKSPLTNIYMLGIVLPTLGLALLPLASTLLGGAMNFTHVFVIFNIIIPFFVFYMTLQVMMKRPGGYGETSLLEKNPYYPQYVSKKPYYIALLIAIPLLILGLLPFVFQVDYFTYNILNSEDNQALFGLKSDYSMESLGLGFLGQGNFFDFRLDTKTNKVVGPFGVGALLLSLLIPLSVVIFFSFSYRLRTKELIKAREQTKALEKEFSSSLFTLGNRLGDGVPAEIAFAKVAESTKGLKTEDFFKKVIINMRSMGMGIEEAIFNNNVGAIIFYPSGLIATSMRILIESSKKGLKVAAQGLMSISEYVNNIEKINERLRDLLAEVVSDMSSNMTFLAPLLSGIVVGLAAMITGILGQLETMLNSGAGDVSVAGIANIAQIMDLFKIQNMIPPYFLQISIGLYIVQIIFILTATLVTIDSGEDKLKRTYDISKNLIYGFLLYLVIATLSIVVLSIVLKVALPVMSG